MADDANEDSWLYGTSNPDSTTNEEEKIELNSENFQPNEDENAVGTCDLNNIEHEIKLEAEDRQSPDSNQVEEENGMNDVDGPGVIGEEDDPASQMEEQEENNEPDGIENGEEGDDDEDDDDRDPGDEDSDESDDDINVVIGDIKSGPTYNIKQRPSLLAASSALIKEKPQQVGKFNIEEFESVGTINGVPAHEFSIDSLEDKPWRKPGADITDYFNYGFNEDTWRSYCERQKRFRVSESGVGLQGLTSGGPTIPVQTGANNRTLTPLTSNENSKYSNTMSIPRRTMPPPQPVKENIIQVMTAECREYSRTGSMTQNNFEEQFFEQDSYSYGYEPTQDSQWMNDNSNWTPSGIKELTPGPPVGPGQGPPIGPGSGPPGLSGPGMGPMPGPGPGQGHMPGPGPQMVPPPMGMHPPIPNMRPPMGMPMNMGPPLPHMQGMQGPGPGMMPPPRMMPPVDRNPHGPPPGMNMDKDQRDRDQHRVDRRHDRDRDRDRERERVDRERDRDRDREKERERDRTVEREWDRNKDKERDREHDRRIDTRGKSEESERQGVDSPLRDRERRRDRHRDRDRERSVRRERSRSREKSRRRSRSRDRDRDREKKSSREKKKSHRKDKEESD